MGMGIGFGILINVKLVTVQNDDFLTPVADYVGDVQSVCLLFKACYESACQGLEDAHIPASEALLGTSQLLRLAAPVDGVYKLYTACSPAGRGHIVHRIIEDLSTG